MSEGLKFDGEKVMMELVDAEVTVELAKVLGYGAKKYAAENWRKGIKYKRIIGAIKRHLAAVEMGEDRDPETGLLHLSHLMCETMFLTSYQLHPERYSDLDDREVQEKSAQRRPKPTPLCGHCAGSTAEIEGGFCCLSCGRKWSTPVRE